MTISGQPAERVPVAFLGRASTLALQDPRASMRRQLRAVQAKLPAGWYVAAYFWDIESGGLDLEARGHGTGHEHVDTGVPRDGGLAALLAEAGSPSPRFAAVMCVDIERSGRDTFNALRLEKKLGAAGIPLLAADEPIDVAGMNATTILVRRVKQGIAEWYRFQLKEKAWAGFTEHALDGYNIGHPPYGYAAHRIPHPNPVKAAQGATKTRLMTDPDKAAVVKQIYAWRVTDRLGCTTIAARLNTDPLKYPPPGRAGCWQVSVLARILANPKYTGHMAYGRTRTLAGQRGRNVPPDQWLWSPEPAHPAIIARPMWDAAQTAGRDHGTSRDNTGLSAHPAAKRTYTLRGLIRCRECQRRMTGHTKRPQRQDGGTTYYACPHDPANPRHAQTSPGHPVSVLVREDILMEVIGQFLDTRIFGPDRSALLRAALPAGAADAARRNQAAADRYQQELRKIDTAENAYAREIEQLADCDPTASAVTALRSRIIARFSELEAHRADLTAKLKTLAATQAPPQDPALLDQLPLLTGILDHPPGPRQQDLYHALGLQLLWDPQDRQVTCRATITASTPATLTAIICDSEPPAASTSPNETGQTQAGRTHLQDAHLATATSPRCPLGPGCRRPSALSHARLMPAPSPGPAGRTVTVMKRDLMVTAATRGRPVLAGGSDDPDDAVHRRNGPRRRGRDLYPRRPAGRGRDRARGRTRPARAVRRAQDRPGRRVRPARPDRLPRAHHGQHRRSGRPVEVAGHLQRAPHRPAARRDARPRVHDRARHGRR
ncbi:MAG: recombinase family protein [Streptosporangiaceae bacterium]